MIHGRRVDLGLGSANLVKFADAREVAADNRAIARTGGDPRRSLVPTFEKAEAICFAEKRDTWRSDSPAHNWRPAVYRYVLSRIGGMPVDKVGSAAVYDVLRLIALAGKHATVKVAGGAITAVLEWARISEFRSERSPVETVRRRLPKHHDAVHFAASLGHKAAQKRVRRALTPRVELVAALLDKRVFMIAKLDAGGLAPRVAEVRVRSPRGRWS